jgi:aminoglycoside phosphotransferase (APT) family kinase protein
VKTGSRRSTSASDSRTDKHVASGDWFTGALTPDVVASQLVRHVPELRAGSASLVHCRVTRIRSVPPEGAWSAIYELEVRSAGADVTHSVIARGTLLPPGHLLPVSVGGVGLGAPGWNCVLPDLRLALESLPLDEGLPGLAQLLDAEQGAALLQQALRESGALPADAVLEGCAADVASHKPGVRATLVCRLSYTRGGQTGPEAVVVKLHADGQGEQGHRLLQQLMSTPLGLSAQLRVPRPLAYVPELHLSVQEHLAHTASLKDLFHDLFDGGLNLSLSRLADLRAGVAAAGAGLAVLHRSGNGHGEPLSWDSEVRVVRQKHRKLAAVVPSLGHPVGSALDRIAAAGRVRSANAPVSSHGSFHPAQVLMMDGAVAFIDFDKSSPAEPACDLAAFITKMRHMAVNKVDTHRYESQGTCELAVENLRDAFVDQYRAAAPLSADRLALWEALELVSLVLSAAKKMLGPRTENCLRMLEHHLHTQGI